MITIKIDNRDLPFTIDTYATFTLDSETEQEIDYYNETNNTELDYDDFDFSFDMNGYIKHLAQASVAILKDELIGDIVKDIELVDTNSPQFYNYTTDSYTANWTIDDTTLTQYCTDNATEWNDFQREEWSTLDFEDSEAVLVARLDYYCRKQFNLSRYTDAPVTDFDDESYILQMFDATNEGALDFIKSKLLEA